MTVRARSSDRAGYVIRDGVKILFEVYENDGPSVLLMPTWSIVHSRHWKAQVSYLARHFRVVTFDGRGNGKSDRPTAPGSYSDAEFVADAVAVLDATDTELAVVAGVSLGAHWSVLLAGLHPERVAGTICIGPTTSLVPVIHPKRALPPFTEPLDQSDGWAKYNMHFWRRDYLDFAEFFFSQVFTEPHSTKPREDAVAWSQETDAETLIAIESTDSMPSELALAALAGIKCPVLVIHGTDDHISPYQAGVALAHATGGSVLLIEGAGHLPQARDPVRINLALKDFIDRVFAKQSVPA
ncbi:MAG: alpha/beta fold hydrolase [Acidimicrobiia bacterium]